jgi:hypothetical protein
MKNILLFFLLPLVSFSQTNPECDSLVIECCFYNPQNPDTITLNVTNNSGYIFPYPGFIIFNTNMDTIAKENVNYFGIANAPQQHVLTVVNSFSLPFVGTLQLYTGFYDSLHCSFPIIITDTVTGIQPVHKLNGVSLFPNPASEYVNISVEGDYAPCQYTLMDVCGRLILSGRLTSTQSRIEIADLKKGIYFIQLSNGSGELMKPGKIIIE